MGKLRLNLRKSVLFATKHHQNIDEIAFLLLFIDKFVYPIQIAKAARQPIQPSSSINSSDMLNGITGGTKNVTEVEENFHAKKTSKSM